MRLSCKKHGGLTFVRVGRLSFSFSIEKAPQPAHGLPAFLGGAFGLGLFLAIATMAILGV
jgi:hypothetical protein